MTRANQVALSSRAQRTGRAEERSGGRLAHRPPVAERQGYDFDVMRANGGHRMKALVALTAFSGLVAVAELGLAGNEQAAWPRFRGPDGSGVAENEKPPVEFGPDKNVKWKVAVPSGLSSPIVAGDNLVLTAFDDGKLFTIAYRRSDGKEA